MLKAATHHRSRPDARYLLFVPVTFLLYLALLVALNCGCDKARRQVPVLEVKAEAVRPAPDPLPTPPDGTTRPVFVLPAGESLPAPTAEPPLELPGREADR